MGILLARQIFGKMWRWTPAATATAGPFSIDQFDLAGRTLAHIVGTIKATRITVDTTITDIL